MNRWLILSFLLVALLPLAGCAGNKWDADKDSESVWKIRKKSLVGGGVGTYDVKLQTQGSKFLAKVKTTYKEPMTGAVIEATWNTVCNGQYVWTTGADGTEFETTRWKVDPELLRPQLFWKTNFLAAEPTENGTEKIDGKSYKVLTSEMSNAMGGTTKYTYWVDEEKGYIRRWTRQFVGDKFVDEYDCVEYKDSSSASGAEFEYSGKATDTLEFDIFNDPI